MPNNSKASANRAEIVPSLSETDAELIIRTMHDTLYRVNSRGELTYVSPSAERLTGYCVSELLGMDVTHLYKNPGLRELFLQRLQENGGVLTNYEVELCHKDGHDICVLINVRYLYDAHDQVIGIEGLIRDITPRKEMEEALYKEREKLFVTLQSIADGVITTDLNGNIEYMNPTAEHITGHSLSKVGGCDIRQIFDPAEEIPCSNITHPVEYCLRHGETIVMPNIRLLNRSDGSEFAVQETAAPIRDKAGQIIGAIVVFHDVTALRDVSLKLAYQAEHDSHTGLLNRHAFEAELNRALISAKKKNQSHVLCYLDLDQFKVVNDTCGHVAGDELLRQLAGLLQSAIRGSDIIARLGGDEFGLLIQGCGLERGTQIAEDIRKVIKEFRFAWQDKLFEIGASVGLVLLDAACPSVSDAMSMADAACFVAKDKGRNRIHTYQKDDHDLVRQQQDMQWIHRIHRAFDENRFILHRQAIHSIRADDTDGRRFYEILIRMRDENGKLTPPMAFIPAAERYNMMETIDRWVVRNALQQLQEECDGQPERCLYSLNLSAASLCNESFLRYLLTTLEQHQVPPSSLCFEITETAAISSLAHAKRFILRLKSLGCKFALDDFGSGLSSFIHLKSLPVDYLKIEGSFVRDMLEDPVSLAMVESIVRVGNVIGIKTIAEYVHNEEILAKLADMGVHYAQGFYIARPNAC